MLPSFVVPTLLKSASDPAVVTGGGALPPDLFDEVLAYLLNHLNEHLVDFYKTPEYASVQQSTEPMVSMPQSLVIPNGSS